MIQLSDCQSVEAESFPVRSGFHILVRSIQITVTTGGNQSDEVRVFLYAKTVPCVKNDFYGIVCF